LGTILFTISILFLPFSIFQISRPSVQRYVKSWQRKKAQILPEVRSCPLLVSNPTNRFLGFSKRRRGPPGFKNYGGWGRSGAGADAPSYTPLLSKSVGLPRNLKVCLRTAAATATAVTGVIYQQYNLKGNSAFDPMGNFAATTPKGWTQFAALYQNYRVHAARVTALWMPNSGGPAIVMAVVPTAVSTGPTYSTALEAGAQAGAKMIYVPTAIAGSGAGVSIGTTGITTNLASGSSITHYASTRNVWGANSIEGDDYFAATNTDPVNLWYFTVALQEISGGTNIGGYLHLKMEQYVEFTERYDNL